VSGSMTNLWGGLELGVNTLVQYKLEGYSDRVFLFSDGLVNSGEKDKKTILRNVSDVYEKHKIQISAFGLGDDFDEVLMKGIADKGVGAYFYIENSGTIPTFVEYALISLQKCVGTRAVIKSRGLSVGVVKKLYGDHNLMTGANLGDLRGDNKRIVLLQAEISPLQHTPIEPVIECELTYTRDNNGIPENITIKRTVTLEYTDDSALINKYAHNEVKVQKNLLLIPEIDAELAVAMSSDKFTEAEALLNKEIGILEEVLEIDQNEFGGSHKVASFLKQAKKNLEDLKEKKKRFRNNKSRKFTIVGTLMLEVKLRMIPCTTKNMQ